MIRIAVKKGYNLNITGVPSSVIQHLDTPVFVAMLPEKIPFIKPKLLVKIGDKVNIGSPLFEDKKTSYLKFMSPGGGVVHAVNFGPRRTIKEIVIKIDPKENQESFDPLSEQDLDRISQNDLVQALVHGGMWHFIKELPFGNTPDPSQSPPAIIVRMFNSEPFHPGPNQYLADRFDLLEYGIKVLNKLSSDIVVSVKDPDAFASNKLKKIATHEICGRYPSDHPGVLVYNTKKKASENRTWFIHGEDLLLVADFLKNGKYPTERFFARSGRPDVESCYIRSRIGARISDILGSVEDDKKRRYIAGGVLTGYEVPADSFMGIYETSLTVFPKRDDNELFGFIRPGIKKPTYSRTFLSFFSSQALDMDACIHGEVRACINCGTCSTVCQVDILPQFTYKAVLADDIEEAVEHGLLDCVECGLCTYVCPSKIELYETLKLAKYAYYNEQI
jgi:Na+-transporting NADH:ubiquinone oxidoreductase subunit A